MIGRCFWVDLSWIVPQMKGFSVDTSAGPSQVWIHGRFCSSFNTSMGSDCYFPRLKGCKTTFKLFFSIQLRSSKLKQMKQRINIVSQACCTCQFKGTFWFTWKTQPERRMWKFLKGNAFYEWRLQSVAVNSGLWTSAVILWKPVDACAVRRHLRLISSQSPNQI